MLGKEWGAMLESYPSAELVSSDGKSRIIVCVYNYEVSQAALNAAAIDWLICRLRVECLDFAGEVDGPYLESGSILRWQAEAEVLCNTYQATGWFSAIEPELEFKLERDELNSQQFKVSGHLTTGRRERSAVLSYEFLTDVRCLRNFVEGLERLCVSFPARNHPTSSP
ncbi:hypothetical protein OIN60_03405 [Paenibacillus sp. P96]|uniref:Uncharacterized protein n=1 Tax=Paenibacillus zeirhizosphaerae TaxID=2987519 RepID=A0ABT9FM68_9BACL|nr:hypothetical protein [Paenibacillus sp. P96]MDP4095837.1 hypothetical protein [Paenibacillus sp. P96]